MDGEGTELVDVYGECRYRPYISTVAGEGEIMG